MGCAPLLVLLLLLVVVAASLLLVANGCVEEERLALLDFKRGLIDDEDHLHSWNSSSRDCCSWDFITCATNNQSSSGGGHVIGLKLWGLYLGGKVSPSLHALRHLEGLYLFYNHSKNPTPAPPFIGSFSNLTELVLVEFTGLIPPELGRLQKLTRLTLDGFDGPIPPELGMLRNLHYLEIGTDMGTKIYPPLYVENSEWISNLPSLATLYLIGVDLGRVLDWELSLSRCSSLQFIQMSDSNMTFRGDINHGFASLTTLVLIKVKFGRSIPSWIFSLNNLTDLGLRDCSLEGVLSEHHFANLTSLQNLDLSNNPLLEIQITPNWVPPFSLITLHLSSCRVGPAFPLWIHSQENLTTLYMSSASLVDFIPMWIWDFSTFLSDLDLSRNKLYGGIPHNKLLPFGEGIVDLSSNNLSGQLPGNISPNLVQMNLAYNSFSGSLSRLLCHKVQTTYAMEILNLDNNLLSGNMSNCWDGWRNLNYLSINNNNLTGSLSDSLANLLELQSLHLRNNRLSGHLPLAIHNWRKLVTLDLSINKLEGSLKRNYWGELSNLRILMLDSNKFSGIIPSGVCTLNSLQILNLSNNNLFGRIPICFKNFTGMIWENNERRPFNVYSNHSYAIERLPLSLKGTIDEYEGILRFVTLLDLSNNRLSGEIPKELMELKGLQYLNISKNQLTGQIPMAISNISALESLDLSRNNLSREIPSTISQLSFLRYLNVSYNKLTGRIPSGSQLDTFNSSAFIGNTLCGKPLPKTCGTSDGSNPMYVTDSKEEKEDDDSLIAFYISFPVGFGAGASTVFITLLFRRSWRITLFCIADRMMNLNSC